MATRTSPAKQTGAHYTPTALANFLGDVTLQHVRRPESRCLRICDPACGDGEILLRSLEWIMSRPSKPARLEVVGCDIDPKAVRRAAERVPPRGSCQVDLIAGNFLEIMHAAARLEQALPPPPFHRPFDVVIGNPPYVRTQNLDRATVAPIASDLGLRGRVDLCHLFCLFATHILRDGGVLGFILSNKFLVTDAGANVRSVLERSYDLIHVYDLGDTRLFDAAVLPAIVVARKRAPDTVARSRLLGPFARAVALQDSDAALGMPLEPSLWDALRAGRDALVPSDNQAYVVAQGMVETDRAAAPNWRLRPTGLRDVLEKIDALCWRRLGQVASVRVGIKTTADTVFIRSDWETLRPQAGDATAPGFWSATHCPRRRSCNDPG